MREFFGMILGCALTILVVYLHDNGTLLASNEPTHVVRPIVNWDVAADEWTRMQHNARLAWDRLTANVEKART
jgi:hypothetical protein